MGKKQKHKKTCEIGELSGQLFPSIESQGCKKQTRQYKKDKRETLITKKDPQKKHHIGMVSKKLLEDPNMFNGTNLTISSDVDQDTYKKVKKNTRKHNKQESKEVNSCSTGNSINPFKHRVLFVGHRQTVKTQIRRRRMWHLISIFCLLTECSMRI